MEIMCGETIGAAGGGFNQPATDAVSIRIGSVRTATNMHCQFRAHLQAM
jgi:hypothetical protein